MKLSPFPDQSHRAGWQRSGQQLECVQADLRDVLAVLGVEEEHTHGRRALDKCSFSV
jgi:hypothetical protein